MTRLVLEIEILGYYVEDIADADDPAEEAEVAMQLASQNVGVVFAHYSGDDPALNIRALDGQDPQLQGVAMSARDRSAAYTSPPVWNAIMAERDRQDAKWGGIPGMDRFDDHTYAAVLGEEFGEVCKAWLERDTVALRVELIQTAAVALAWVEELDNTDGAARAA